MKYILIILLFWGCNSTQENKKDIHDFFIEKEFINRTKATAIIPLRGCSGCVDKSVYLLEQVKNKDDFTIVLCGIITPNDKVIANKLKARFKNIVLDRMFKVKDYADVKNYPVFIKEDKKYLRLDMETYCEVIYFMKDYL